MYWGGVGRGLPLPNQKSCRLETTDYSPGARGEVPEASSPPARGVSPGPKHGYGHGLGFGRGIMSLKLASSPEPQQIPGSKMSPSSPVSPRLTSPAYITPVRLDSLTDSLRSSPSPPAVSDVITEECSFCQRPASTVVCRSCGHTFKGRVRSPCNLHPGVIHLMDCQCCPNCKASNLQEFTSKHVVDNQFSIP